MVKNNDHVSLLERLVSLLKPGGYLQWIESDISSQKGVTAHSDAPREVFDALVEDGNRFLKSAGISYDWLQDLPESCRRVGMTKVRLSAPEPNPAFRPIFGSVALGGWEELSAQILDKYGPNPILGSGTQLRQRLLEARRELEKGTSLEQQLYVFTAQKPETHV